MASEPFLAGLADAVTQTNETQYALVERVNQGIGFDGSTDAYDGSNEPQKRDLTARERDVLCGLINDIVGSVKRTGDVELNGLRGGQDWLNHLIAIRNAIQPRKD